MVEYYSVIEYPNFDIGELLIVDRPLWKSLPVANGVIGEIAYCSAYESCLSYVKLSSSHQFSQKDQRISNPFLALLVVISVEYLCSVVSYLDG